MKAWMDRLNLQPQERRGLLGVLVLVALVLNYWFVWPQFGEWAKNQGELGKLEARKRAYASEIGREAAYKARISSLQNAGAGGVLKEEEANRLQDTIYREAALHNVSVPKIHPGRSPSGTNDFFDEQIMQVDVTAGEADLIGFLFALGSSDSMIRVRDLTNLKLDLSQTKLQAKVTFVASFQKKPKTPPPAVAGQASSAIPGAVQSKGAGPAAKAGVTNRPATNAPGAMQPIRPKKN
jgi:hypothetical protein